MNTLNASHLRDPVDNRTPASPYNDIYMYRNIYTCVYMHYTTRIPMLLALKVYIRSCRMSVYDPAGLKAEPTSRLRSRGIVPLSSDEGSWSGYWNRVPELPKGINKGICHIMHIYMPNSGLRSWRYNNRSVYILFYIHLHGA